MKADHIIARCACGGVAALHQKEDGFTVICPHAPKWYIPIVHKTERKAIQAWNELQAGMDRLSRKAMIADHRGVSYGQYEAQLRDAGKEKRDQDSKVYIGQEQRSHCVICGEPIPKGVRNRRKYCSATCAHEAANRQREENRRRRMGRT